MNILIVLTSHDKFGDTGKPTGFWFEELAAPYYTFLDAGAKVTLASPAGGAAPLDPASNEPAFQTDFTRRFEADADATKAAANTRKLSDVDVADYDAVFYPGGYGPLWDLVSDAASLALIEAAARAGKPIGAVCHASAVLRDAKAPDGKPLIQGRKVAGFTNAEEEALGLTAVVPFSVEDALKQKGGDYSSASNFEAHVVTDGLLVTGQNPASAAPAAKALLALIN